MSHVALMTSTEVGILEERPLHQEAVIDYVRAENVSRHFSRRKAFQDPAEDCLVRPNIDKTPLQPWRKEDLPRPFLSIVSSVPLRRVPDSVNHCGRRGSRLASH